MNDRDRFIATVLGKPVDRPPYWLYWSPWSTTRKRWAQEAQSGKTIEGRHVPAYAGDRHAFRDNVRLYFDSDQPPRPIPVNCGPCPKIEKKIIQETDEFETFIDGWGIKRKDFRHQESMSDFIEFPVKNREDWERFKAERLDPDHPDRLQGDWRDLCAQWTAKGVPIQLGEFPDAGVFGPYRWLLGDEEGMVAFHTMPDLVHDIMDHITTLYLTVFEKVVSEVRVDVIHLWEDMCYRNGPLISPKHWEEFLGPNYRRIKKFAQKHNIPVISVDTDGDPDQITTPMMRAGVNLLFPMEVAAGCDVNLWRNKYPTLGMMGGIDKRALALGPEAIDQELARIQPLLEKGRYIPALDHLVPDDVSWDNYCYYADSLKRVVGKT